jgi:ribosomal protein L30/L7E
MQKFKEDANNTQQIIELLKVVIIDLIGGYSSHNTKLRVLSEQVFKELFELLAELKAVPNLFQLLLVGFAGTKA